MEKSFNNKNKSINRLMLEASNSAAKAAKIQAIVGILSLIITAFSTMSAVYVLSRDQYNRAIDLKRQEEIQELSVRPYLYFSFFRDPPRMVVRNAGSGPAIIDQYDIIGRDGNRLISLPEVGTSLTDEEYREREEKRNEAYAELIDSGRLREILGINEINVLSFNLVKGYVIPSGSDLTLYSIVDFEKLVEGKSSDTIDKINDWANGISSRGATITVKYHSVTHKTCFIQDLKTMSAPATCEETSLPAK